MLYSDLEGVRNGIRRGMTETKRMPKIWNYYNTFSKTHTHTFNKFDKNRWQNGML